MAKSKSSSTVFNLTETADEFLTTKPAAPKVKRGRPKKALNERERASIGELKSCTLYLTPEAHTKLKMLTVVSGKTLSEVASEAVIKAYEELNL